VGNVVVQYADPVRNVDMVFVASLDLLERDVRPLPGSFVHRKEVDPRLTGLKVMMTSDGAAGPREGDEIALYESVALMRHRPTGHVYLAFRQTMDLLMMEQRDPKKYPMWLMDHPVKRTELKIHVARVKSKPAGKDDREWLEWLPETPADDRVFDSIAYFLLRRQVISEAMYGQG
jgi:hypothetical protein